MAGTSLGCLKHCFCHPLRVQGPPLPLLCFYLQGTDFLSQLVSRECLYLLGFGILFPLFYLLSHRTGPTINCT